MRFFGCLFRLIGLVVIVGLVVVGWSFIEPYIIQVKEYTLSYPTLPSAFDGLRVAFVSDLHWGPYFDSGRLDDLIRKVNNLAPDVILLGGDYAVDSNGVVDFFARRPGFSAPMGVYAIPGNHDRTQPESNRALQIQGIRDSGFLPLYNAVYPLQKDGQFLYLAGIDDLKTGHPDINGVAASLNRDDFVILLAHDPDGIRGITQATDAYGQRGWADLILCGHTHGGQVNIGPYSPFLNRVVRDTQFRYGLHHVDGSDVIITSGIGTSGAPMRLGAMPEIVLITLRVRQ